MPIRANLTVERGAPGVIVVRAARIFEQDIREGDALRVEVDPRAWISDVQFDVLFDETEAGATAVFGEGSQATRAVVTALTTRAQPRLSWME